MTKVERKMINENGHEVTIEVVDDHRGVTVYAQGPTSEVRHTWTLLEAMVLRDLLNELVASYTTDPTD